MLTIVHFYKKSIVKIMDTQNAMQRLGSLAKVDTSIADL